MRYMYLLLAFILTGLLISVLFIVFHILKSIASQPEDFYWLGIVVGVLLEKLKILIERIKV